MRRAWVKWRLIIEQVLAERVEDAQVARCWQRERVAVRKAPDVVD